MQENSTEFSALKI